MNICSKNGRNIYFVRGTKVRNFYQIWGRTKKTSFLAHPIRTGPPFLVKNGLANQTVRTPRTRNMVATGGSIVEKHWALVKKRKLAQNQGKRLWIKNVNLLKFLTHLVLFRCWLFISCEGGQINQIMHVWSMCTGLQAGGFIQTPPVTRIVKPTLLSLKIRFIFVYFKKKNSTVDKRRRGPVTSRCFIYL